jgi:hypothetical protein
MNTRLPALLGALALGVMALTGCSVSSAGAADAAGIREPLVKASTADADPVYVAVRPLSENDFNDQTQRATCASSSGITYCQELEGDPDLGVMWTAYIAVPWGEVDATMTIDVGTGASGDSTYTAPVHADTSYAQVTWGSPQIQAVPNLSTDVRVTLHDGSTYAATAHPSLDPDGMYTEDDLAVNPA